ncbi:MAG: histidine--tRNA ligase [Cytophagaceae bacterium]|jgi:histidyl-tRNA synthetase|nr:histidine--tRNA ligase [Cytophagaceae bacterium]
MEKPSLPKGTRDFGPAQMLQRTYLIDTIKLIFKKFGFLPLETPSMENLQVLTGKYGDEGDQLIFKILNSGDFLSDLSSEQIEEGSKKLLPRISKKALRYDLTVPFARYVVMNRHAISFPFKRYQIQPVWRADRPQKGRYCEFYQCDADIVGTESLLCEAEIICMVQEVFKRLNLHPNYIIKLNNRKILTGITESIGKSGSETDLCIAIDKLDKIGIEGVKKELEVRHFTAEQIDQLLPIVLLTGSNQEKLHVLSSYLKNSDIGLQGIEEIKTILNLAEQLNADASTVEIDLTLARGLSYYTGAIFEVKSTTVSMGSICGGGRYDNLTGVFGMPNVSGVGISFGIDRIYDVLEELKLFPGSVLDSSMVLLCAMDELSFLHALPLLKEFRAQNIPSELYPDTSKLKKQLSYADAKQIPYALLIGENERQQNVYTFKNLTSGEQKNLSLDEMVSFLRSIK